MPSAPATLLVFVSMFAAGEKGGVQAYHLDAKSGGLAPAAVTHGAENTFFLALAPDRKHLYGVNAKRFGSPEPEEVVAWRVLDRDGRLEPVNRESSRGSATCFLDVDPSGKTLLLANYSSRSVASLPIRADGSLGAAASFVEHQGSSVNPDRQKGPYPHSFVPAPGGRFAYAADLGTDQIHCYRLDAAAATVAPLDPPAVKSPPGAGPRHLAFHPDGRRLYAINELLNSVTVFDFDAASGRLTAGPTVPTLPDDFKGVSHCADVKITPDGTFLYGTSRGHDSIAVFRIGGDGRLERVGIVPSRGKGPQNLAITPDGTLLLCANMPGKNLAVFRIDPATGGLEPIGEPTAVESPSCILLVP